MSVMKRNSGFTLIELMVTIAVLAIGTAIAFPSFTSIIRSNRVATGTNGITASLNLARTEGIRSNRGGGVCPSSDGATCSGSDWNIGMLVFTDIDGNGAWSAGDVPLKYFDARRGLSLSAQPAAAGGGALVSEVMFDARGRVGAGVEIVLKPDDCTSGVGLQRRIHITRFGQMRTSQENCE